MHFQLKTGLSQLKSQDFFPPYMAATKCGISSFALSRLTGRVLVAVEKVRKPAKKFNRNKKRKDLVATTEGGSESGSDTSDVSSEDDFPALEPEVQKFNIGLDLKFNKTNMEVRGYTSKREGQWYYSVNTIQLVNGTGTSGILINRFNVFHFVHFLIDQLCYTFQSMPTDSPILLNFLVVRTRTKTCTTLLTYFLPIHTIKQWK